MTKICGLGISGRIAPQTLAAHFKKDTRLAPMIDQVLKYQVAALEAAYYGLDEK